MQFFLTDGMDICAGGQEPPPRRRPLRSRNGSPGAYIPLKVHVHGRGLITKSFALLHEVTVPRPREMIGQYWNSVFSEEREHFEPRLDRLLGIRVIEKIPCVDSRSAPRNDARRRLRRTTTDHSTAR